LYNDTIIAPATPPGEGGIAILRLSGPESETFLQRFFQPTKKTPSFKSHRLYHGFLYDPSGIKIDEVLAVIMRSPHSYTREDVVEIHCHGGQLLTRRILDLFIDAGVRLSRPGEFTLRAFINGRIDLSQAEGVIDLIRSRSDVASRIALQQMDGSLSRRLHRYMSSFREILAQIEAEIDFPEDEIPQTSYDTFLHTSEQILSDMKTLLASFDMGRILREGISVILLGSPNVGKSSLLNRLLGEDRAIVSEIPGTTRDTIEEQILLNGLPLRLVDTAGLRVSDNPIEAEGVERTRRKVESADIILLMIDSSNTHPIDPATLDSVSNKKVLLVVNKVDLCLPTIPDNLNHLPSVCLSALTGEGVDKLKDMIVSIVLPETPTTETHEDFCLSDRRHREAVQRSSQSLESFVDGLKSKTSSEFLATDLRNTLFHLGSVTGETTTEDILDMIFSKFCIGK